MKSRIELEKRLSPRPEAATMEGMTEPEIIYCEWDPHKGYYKPDPKYHRGMSHVRGDTREEFNEAVQRVFPLGTPITVEYDNETVELPPLGERAPP